MSAQEDFARYEDVNVYNNLVGAAISGSFVALYVSTISVFKARGNKGQYDAYYSMILLASGYMMSFVFFALLISNFLVELREQGGNIWTVYVYQLSRFDVFILIITMQVMAVLHHTLTIVRIQYEMKRDRQAVSNWFLRTALILTVLYALLLIFVPFLPFVVIFFNIDTIPHIIQIVLYCQLKYTVKKRGEESQVEHPESSNVAIDVDREMQQFTELATRDPDNDQTEPAQTEENERKEQEDRAPPAVVVEDRDSTMFCNTLVFPGHYESNAKLVERYNAGIAANLLHQFSGFVMLGARVLLSDGPIIRYNLDIIVGYALVVAGIKQWEKLMCLTPAAFSEKLKQ